MYSLTQGGNIGQLIAMGLVLIGMDTEEAQQGANAVLVTAGLIGYVISWAVAWYGRFRKGDVTLAGFKK